MAISVCQRCDGLGRVNVVQRRGPYKVIAVICPDCRGNEVDSLTKVCNVLDSKPTDAQTQKGSVVRKKTMLS
jgi:hypothetical protein